MACLSFNVLRSSLPFQRSILQYGSGAAAGASLIDVPISLHLHILWRECCQSTPVNVFMRIDALLKLQGCSHEGQPSKVIVAFQHMSS